jgi:acyl-CoA thioester hydrolase
LVEPDPGIERVHFRVRYNEADAMTIAYYGAYLDWFSMGRSELLRRAGLPYHGRFERHGLFLPVVEVGCRYRRPMPLDAEGFVDTWVERLTRTRMDFRYTVWRAGPTPVLAAEGFTRHAFVDRSGRPVDAAAADPELWEALQRHIRVRP